jgi:hypothetical protein
VIRGIAREVEQSWTDEEQRAVLDHIDEGYLQAERGELIDSAQARQETQTMKANWRSSKQLPETTSRSAG